MRRRQSGVLYVPFEVSACCGHAWVRAFAQDVSREIVSAAPFTDWDDYMNDRRLIEHMTVAVHIISITSGRWQGQVPEQEQRTNKPTRPTRNTGEQGQVPERGGGATRLRPAGVQVHGTGPPREHPGGPRRPPSHGDVAHDRRAIAGRDQDVLGVGCAKQRAGRQRAAGQRLSCFCACLFVGGRSIEVYHLGII